MESEPRIIEKVLREASKADIILGKGYGELLNSTFRVANFPAIKKSEITYLRTFFEAELN